MDEHNHERLRQRIARAMGREQVAEETWEILIAKGHIQDVVDGLIDEATVVELAKALTFYTDLVKQAEVGAESKDSGWEVHPPRSDGYEADRAKTFAEYLELEVAMHPRVLEWRRSSFGTTRTASARGAYELVDNPEIREAASGLHDVAANQVAPSGSLDFYGSEPGQVHRVDFYEGSILEGLRDVSEELRDELFPLWTQADAAWIIVTGKLREVPRSLVAEIEGFSNHYLAYGTVNLKVEPWITGDVVLRAYQHLQSLALLRRPRALSERNLAMTRWVMERLRNISTLESDGEATSFERMSDMQRLLNTLLEEESDEQASDSKVSWRRLMAWWNQEHPEWAFRDERNFFRDCRLIIKAVARPFDATVLSDDPSGSSPRVSIPEADDGEYVR